MELAVGDLAPDFVLLSDQNEPVQLSQLQQTVVLYFYPKDNTPGCTKEACDFRDRYAELLQQNVRLLGVSKDSIKSHVSFKDKFELPFTLLVDQDADVAEAYGVIQPKNMYGKTVLGVVRSSFLIDKTRIIRAIWRQVKVDGHIDEVIHAVKQLH